MNIEQMKKVNSMTKVLQQHGFASDAGEGVTQSQRIFGVTGVNEGFEQATVVQARLVSASQLTPEDQSSLDVLHATFAHIEKFQQECDERLLQLETSVSAMIKKINELIGAVKTIEEQPSTAPSYSQVNTLAYSTPSAVSSSPQPEQPRIQPSQGTSEQNKPRTGDFKPGDIDLNKVFYCGQK